jgi:uncharacterized protein YndB with AHSA1/START domain
MTAPATTDYQKTIRVEAPPDAVFDAVTTAAGLSSWWVPAEGAGDTGGELRFSMSVPEPVRMHVDEATRPTLVRWTVTDCPVEPEWVGTHPTFTITPLGTDSCELTFRHVGLNDEMECIDMCTNGWNHYLASLRDYVETGHGNPRGSEADLERRAAESTR